MVIGNNSVPTRISDLGSGEEGKFIRCKQLNYATAQLWNSWIVLQLSSEQHSREAALGCPGQCRGVAAPAREMQSSVERGSRPPKQEGSSLI